MFYPPLVSPLLLNHAKSFVLQHQNSYIAHWRQDPVEILSAIVSIIIGRANT
jgi:hypothetical protein